MTEDERTARIAECAARVIESAPRISQEALDRIADALRPAPTAQNQSAA